MLFAEVKTTSSERNNLKLDYLKKYIYSILLLLYFYFGLFIRLFLQLKNREMETQPSICMCRRQISERLEYKISHGKVRGLQQLKDFCLI